MEIRRAIEQVLADLPDNRVREVLDFARYLAQPNDAGEWREFGQSQFARAYGDDEPEYFESDVKPEFARR